MKKIFSLAMMAMMAFGAAVTTVSCTNNDDDIPAVDTKVNLAAGVNTDASSYNCEKELFTALLLFYQGKVGSTGTVRYANTSGQYNLYFTTTKANLNAFKQALKNITDEETNAVVKNFKFNWLNITVTDGNEAVLKFNCEKVQKDEPKAEEQKEETKKAETKYYPIEAATWTSTIHDVKYTLELTSEKVSDYKYKATLHVGDKVVPGKAFSTDGVSFGFLSDENVNGITLYNVVVSYDSVAKTMKGYVLFTLIPYGTGEFSKM